uniref:Sprouty n=1 Tax=Parascaris univalens TaxID=6257 RepID=A0A915AVR2_PARUN
NKNRMYESVECANSTKKRYTSLSNENNEREKEEVLVYDVVRLYI